MNSLSNKISNYYLTTPENEIFLFYPFMSIDYKYCPFYAPFAKNTECRFCRKKDLDHKKYYIFSNLARKIQKIWFEYLFLLFYKQIISKNIYNNPITLLRYKIRFFRNWNLISYLNYLKYNNYV